MLKKEVWTEQDEKKRQHSEKLDARKKKLLEIALKGDLKKKHGITFKDGYYESIYKVKGEWRTMTIRFNEPPEAGSWWADEHTDIDCEIARGQGEGALIYFEAELSIYQTSILRKIIKGKTKSYSYLRKLLKPKDPNKTAWGTWDAKK